MNYAMNNFKKKITVRISMVRMLLFLLGVAAANLILASAIEASETIDSAPIDSPVCINNQGRFGGDVWELSTRNIGCVNSAKSGWMEKLKVSRWVDRSWATSTISEAIYQDSDSVVASSVFASSIVAPRTIIYIHGNWMEREKARERIGIIDRFIAKSASEPYRLLMISWPSEKNGPILRDIRENARLADANSVIVAELLRSLAETATQVSLLGFSLGARTVTGALHLDAMEPTNGKLYRVSLVAPAVDRDWLQPNGRMSLALTNVDQMVNLYNSKDPILRRFWFIDAIARPIAAGFAGFEIVANLRSRKPLTTNSLIRQYDCRSSIGSTHTERSYYGECSYAAIAMSNLLGK